MSKMLSVRVEDGLKQRLKVAVAERGVTMEEGVVAAVERWLAPEGQRRAVEPVAAGRLERDEPDDEGSQEVADTEPCRRKNCGHYHTGPCLQKGCTCRERVR